MHLSLPAECPVRNAYRTTDQLWYSSPCLWYSHGWSVGRRLLAVRLRLTNDVFFAHRIRFEINLANNRGDVILHINPRVNDRQLVLNAAPGGGWGQEERKPLPFSQGQTFTMIIMVTEQGFKVRTAPRRTYVVTDALLSFCQIAINNQHVADFNHRMQFQAADRVTVKGDVSLSQVQVYAGMSGQHGQPWRFAMVWSDSHFVTGLYSIPCPL